MREVSAPGSYWEDGKWVEVEAMSIKREYDFPQVGQKDMYLLHHEEIESLAKNIPGVKRIRFFMTFWPIISNSHEMLGKRWAPSYRCY